MIGFSILSAITFLPLLGAIFILFIRGSETEIARNAKNAAMLFSVATFALSLYMYLHFDPTSSAFQFVETSKWFPAFDISYKMGVDGISVFFVLLSTFLTPICIMSSWNAITVKVKEYMIAFLLLETMMIGMFCALDTILFYVFFEGVLIPMFVIIGVWGGPRRVYASFKFFLYTLLGSVLMLIAFLTLYFQYGTTDVETLMAADIAPHLQTWLWLAFFASFAVKVPMWPVHTWLPDAHVEAPTAGSVILAGVLLKMGGYGFLRFSIPMLPLATDYFIPLVFTLSVIAIIYTSLVALVQTDMKKLIAYSSVAHMGFVTLGTFSLTTQGVEGAVFQMLSHGIISAALFLCVGVVYDRLHTREISRYGGIVNNMPRYAVVFMVFVMGALGLPATSGFVGEFLILIGTFQVSTTFTFIAAIGVILGAAYMLYLYRGVVFGPLVHADARAMPDLSMRETAIFLPLVALVLWMGIHPASFLKPIQPSVANLLKNYQIAVSPEMAAEAKAAEAEAEETAPVPLYVPLERE